MLLLPAPDLLSGYDDEPGRLSAALGLRLAGCAARAHAGDRELWYLDAGPGALADGLLRRRLRPRRTRRPRLATT